MNDEKLGKIRKLRTQGQIAAAFTLISEVLRDNNVNRFELIEALRLSILLEQNELAYDIYLALKKFPDFEAESCIEILTRLKLVSENRPVQELQTVAYENSMEWCRRVAAEGEDALYKVSIRDCSIDCHDGTINYAFHCICTCCNGKHCVHIARSLIVYREFFCPVCLARQFIDSDIINHYLVNTPKYGNEKNLEACHLHLKDLETEINFDPLEADRFPLLCQYLNIDYTFFLIQLILKRQFEAG